MVAAVALLTAWSALALVVAASVEDDRFTITVEADASTHPVAGSQWTTATQIHQERNHSAGSSQHHHQGIFLAVGVKTNVVHRAAARQAIRETWGHPERADALGVRIWFVGCEPDLSALAEADRASTIETIELEKETHQDLLTHELRCEDSFAGHVNKTIEFMHFVDAVDSSSSLTTPAFVMMADDHVFVRLDQLIPLLQSGTLPDERLYAGNAATDDQRGVTPPVRDPQSRVYLPIDVYPMSELPPYVAGAHYILSRDMAQFVARNRDDLQGFGGLDDVTMAMWMLCLQVHPVFLNSFQMLGNAPCTNDLVSYANVSPTAMHQLQSNLQGGRSFCANFSHELWRQDASLGNAEGTRHVYRNETAARAKFKWDLQHDPTSMSLHIQVDVVFRANRTRLDYVPSAGAYDAVFCRDLLHSVRTMFRDFFDSSFCARHRRALLNLVVNDAERMPSLRAKLEIARHNLARAAADEASGTTSPVVTVVLSPESTYTRVVLECLLTQIYHDHHVVVLNERDLAPDAAPPDIFVFTVLDEIKRSAQTEPSSPHHMGPGAAFVYKYGPTSRLLMVSGEAWPTVNLHPHVTLLSTIAAPRHTKHLYLPYASASFGEMVRHDPLQLLRPTLADTDTARLFCAYLYSNCNVALREHMFDLVNAIEPVHAIGRCKGTHREPDDLHFENRYAAFYIDRAVDSYRGYKFVIAFENTVETPGYVTEKIVTAFLAGAVPIYYGDAATVVRLFNPKAFINCGAFESIERCVERVERIHTTPSEYEAMRQEPPISNRTAFLEFFSWHPTVAEMAKAAAGAIVPLRTQLEELLLG